MFLIRRCVVLLLRLVLVKRLRIGILVYVVVCCVFDVYVIVIVWFLLVNLCSFGLVSDI